MFDGVVWLEHHVAPTDGGHFSHKVISRSNIQVQYIFTGFGFHLKKSFYFDQHTPQNSN